MRKPLKDSKNHDLMIPALALTEIGLSENNTKKIIRL